MLTFGVEAGPVPNKADLQTLFDVITERLKRLYGVRGLRRLRRDRAEGEGRKVIPRQRKVREFGSMKASAS
jgi:hypothetical protein